MKSIQILQREHLLIRRLLDALEALIAETERSRVLPEGPANELMKLFEVFADGTHQEKEERFLFARLLQRASEEEARVIQRLLNDHQGEHQRMLSMWSHLTSAMFGEPISVREFLQDAKEYLQFHRDHMAHEATIVFPMGERMLTAEDDAEIVHGFRAIDQAQPPAILEERVLRTCKALGAPTAMENTSS